MQPNFLPGKEKLPLRVQIAEKSQYIDALVWILRDRVWHETTSDIFVIDPDNEVSFYKMLYALKQEGLPWKPEDVKTKPRTEAQGEKKPWRNFIFSSSRKW